MFEATSIQAFLELVLYGSEYYTLKLIDIGRDKLGTRRFYNIQNTTPIGIARKDTASIVPVKLRGYLVE